MKTHSNALGNMKGFGIAFAYAVVSHTAGAEPWAVDANPANGFEGRTDLWELTQPGTMYAEWDVFGSLSDNTPELSFGLGSASVTESSGTAFLTGGGNIYSFSGVTTFTTTLAGTEPASEGTRTVVARIKTLGTTLADDSVLLTVGGMQYQPAQSHLLYNLALGGFGGNDQEKIFVWTAPDGDYTFNFSASESSLSLAKYATYASEVTPVPEPSTCVLFGIASVVVLCMARRRSGAAAMRRANA